MYVVRCLHRHSGVCTSLFCRGAAQSQLVVAILSTASPVCCAGLLSLCDSSSAGSVAHRITSNLERTIRIVSHLFPSLPHSMRPGTACVLRASRGT